MDEDDDDLYGGGSADQQNQQQTKEEDEDEHKMEVSEEEEDDDDSDDDVQITLEKPEGAKASEPPAKQQKTKHERTASESKPATSSTPIKTEGSTAPPTQVKTTLTHNGKEGKDFPEVRSKNPVDVNAIPTWTNGKPLTAVDIDADLAENSKPWRLPGTDATDFFNYGFDEYTWASYCVKQQMIGNQIGQIKQEDAQMKAFMGIGGDDNKQGGGGMPPMPPGMDMNDPNAMANMMQQFGMDPSQFMQGMNGFGGGMGGMPGMGGMGGMGGQGGGQQFQQGGFGNGQNSETQHNSLHHSSGSEFLLWCTMATASGQGSELGHVPC
ncbi:Pre-mRNA polyadenylation factor [Fulvia fulva]|uniref:Pre-mRNA polyadenylation factor n=1 Tax=Passalora fulva TaxID=5499 RepID=A0A9Q8PEJ7_PASFU|nr:Pre-mRNA polyadenylation factor [Fulvia fulva]KAK4617609.1 Pre-mRNA polyadenylation factor [Fulvia fulva]KAK4618772.1 Pre-mRNA polyadenylation factor [Fulvia fulva]UJO21004.1 Pre-mRNA polyadenylation factor [Fulvia fulva]WPV18536.1 Pre-mRNA polyadenylation factor [Fulvia fulva]WPV33051.1 Pre-mRNA polyadenylation factor [Fulvia fulva]